MRPAYQSMSVMSPNFRQGCNEMNYMKKAYMKYVMLMFLGVSNLACSEKNTVVVDDKSSSAVIAKQLIYKIEKQYSKMDSDDSPSGYWEVDLSYPVIDNPSNTAEIIRINTAIKDLVDKYTCTDGGDKTFTGALVNIDANMVSLEYESMWMCATMAQPDTDSGIVVFDVRTGQVVDSGRP